MKYLEDKDLNATFFVVGSRVVSYPDILIAEYMAGHEIAVHTWSHHVRYSPSHLAIDFLANLTLMTLHSLSPL